ncbi:RnfABCDGE type electron transport complex subunit G [Thauera sp.]|jgi:electron transport complex protein RnfG|uniref:RnfABCDGE type electron transport complex subunit G n=1 Tax=Thauera sp. TaxID=1905334 RepID=UPI002612F096|nr:RnfABCDGE type electron transport complex subunit G [Thauera sp.]MCK6410063.1 RnfABCDGE type electron transport complex subunit G [Thauera sp.]
MSTLATGGLRQRPGLLLGAFALGCSALLGAGDLVTRAEIRLRQAEDLRHALDQTLASVPHDNNPADDTVAVDAGNGKTITIYRARQGGEISGVAFNWVGEAGYGGPITLTVGVAHDGRIASVRVLSHSETPGLGDKIDVRKSDWIRAFDGRGLDTGTRWAVRKDGGDFDQFAGATITPRAVVGAVHDSLRFYAAQRERLLAPQAPASAGREGEPAAVPAKGSAS